MRELYFKYPVFHKGANVTVRLGTKWDGYSGPVDIKNQNDQFVKEAEVVSTEVKKFNELTDYDVLKEHDPNCVRVDQLAKMMEEVYGDEFSEEKEVTIVTFVVE